MSRIVLVGEPGAPTFAGHRFRQFRAALEGHDVTEVDAHEPPPGVTADAVVTAGTYLPTRVGLRLAGNLPLWIDLPGDPFADAQWAAGDDTVAKEATAVFAPALARGDAFSTISHRHRHAILGQLGLLGRLARTPAGEEWAAVVPTPWDFGVPEGPVKPGGVPRRAVLSGSFNGWFDDETMLAGILRAMEQSDLRVDITGGAVLGHAPAGFARFRDGASASVHRDRFYFHGWLSGLDLVRVVRSADVGVCLDRPGYEPEFGSRTRVLFWIHQGLPVISTAATEMVAGLVARGFVTAVDVGDAVGLANRLCANVGPLPDRQSLAKEGGPHATEALAAWAREPRRRAPGSDALVAMTIERDALRRELEAVYQSPTWRALDRMNRIVKG